MNGGTIKQSLSFGVLVENNTPTEMKGNMLKMWTVFFDGEGEIF